MATPFDTHMNALHDAERAEIEKILAAKGPGWASDEGDGMLIWAILAAFSAFGVVATFVVYGVDEIAGFFTYAMQALPYSLQSPIAGFVVACAVLPICIYKFVTLHGRFGWMATSFGYLRVRGPALRLVRWADITLVSRRRISGRHPFSIVEMATKQGAVFESMTGALMTEIKQRVPAGTPISE